MRPAYQSFLQKAQILLILALGTVPVPMVLLGFSAEHLLPYVWVFPTLYMLLALLSMKIPGKLRIVYGVVGVLFLMLPGLLVPAKPIGSREVVFIVGAFYGVLLMLSLQIAGWPQDRELPLNYPCYCLALHLISRFTVTLDTVRGETWNSILPWLTATLFMFVGLVMLSMNRSSVKAVTGKRQGASAAIRGKNILLTLALFAAALLASMIPSIMSGVISAIGWITVWTAKLFSMLLLDVQPTYLPTESITATTETEIGMIPTKPVDPVASSITFAIMMIIAVVILLPLVIIALIRIWKVLRRFGRRFWQWFQDMLSNAAEEYYEDEITDTREESELSTTVKQHAKRLRSAFVQERKLTAEQKIRHRYRRLAAKHKEWSVGNTARENLPMKAAELYERARYSNHPISEEDASQFKTETKEV